MPSATFLHADRVLVVYGAGDRGEGPAALAERIKQAGGSVTFEWDEGVTHCVVSPEEWSKFSQGVSGSAPLKQVMAINSDRATDFSAPQIPVLPLLWLTASLSLSLKIPEPTHSLLISRPTPPPSPHSITRDLNPATRETHTRSPTLSPRPSPRNKRAGGPGLARSPGRSRSTVAEGRLRDKWEATRERRAEVMVRERSGGSSEGERREMVRGWLGGAAEQGDEGGDVDAEGERDGMVLGV